jgi:hypothetical protein
VHGFDSRTRCQWKKRDLAISQHIRNKMHLYEVRPRKDKRGVDLISDELPFGRLWYTKPDDAIGYAEFRS